MWKKDCYEGKPDTRESLITSSYLSYGLAQLAGIPPNAALPMPVADGLWADYNDGTWPACCSGPQFDKEQSFVLDTSGLWSFYMPFSFHDTDLRSLPWIFAGKWYHSSGLKKHGTCSYPVVHDEYEYFLMTLNVYFKYNVTGVLFEAGYVPSNSEKYPLGGIISAIQNAFHATPELICSGDAVEELRICFYKDLQPRDCASGSIIKSGRVSSGSCPQYVSLPVNGSGGLDNTTADFLSER
uniref:RNase NGR2 n=1 Tax=Solanum tuberosum TaxID=4113 RepID=M1CNB4_SOLTU